MKGFAYHEPRTISEACSILANYAGTARALAGGTDLLPRMKDGVLRPPALVNLKKLDLSGIKDNGHSVFIGALTTLTEVIDSPIINAKLPLLQEAATKVASVHIRNLATIGGNLCNASPSADTAPALLVMDTKVSIMGPGGYWELPYGNRSTGSGRAHSNPLYQT